MAWTVDTLRAASFFKQVDVGARKAIYIYSMWYMVISRRILQTMVSGIPSCLGP